MHDANVALKIFSANIIEDEMLGFPVKVELLDLGLNPLFETTATGKDEDRNYVFSDDRYIAQSAAGRTSAEPTGFKVRFTAGDKSLVKDFPV